MPLFVALMVIAEIAYMAKNTTMFDSLVDMFSKSPPSTELEVMGGEFGAVNSRGRVVEGESREEWLEREDAVVCSRNFEKDPVFVRGREKINDFEGGGVAIRLSCNHMHTDLISLTLLVKAWSEVHRHQTIVFQSLARHAAQGPNFNTK